MQLKLKEKLSVDEQCLFNSFTLFIQIPAAHIVKEASAYPWRPLLKLWGVCIEMRGINERDNLACSTAPESFPTWFSRDPSSLPPGTRRRISRRTHLLSGAYVQSDLSSAFRWLYCAKPVLWRTKHFFSSLSVSTQAKQTDSTSSSNGNHMRA